MSSTGYENSSWTTEELERRVKLYETPKGHFDPSKIYVSTAADVTFIGSLVVAALIFISEFFIFLSWGKLWSSEHFVAMGMLEVYPLALAAVLSLYVIGHRYDESQKYFHYKKLLKYRKALEKTSGTLEKFT